MVREIPFNKLSSITIFCALKDARTNNKPAMFMDSEVLVDTSSDVLGRDDWALAGGGG